ncbi:MAG: TonB family protein [Candidatus Omnitrophota bacterium]
MFSDRLFQISFLFSLIAHAVILFQNPHLAVFSSDKKEQKLEVRYIKNTLQRKELTVTSPSKEELASKTQTRMALRRMTAPPYIDKEKIFTKSTEIVSQKSFFNKPALVKPDIIAIKKKITLPAVDVSDINNPSYINYYQIVREKIKRAAYHNYARTEIGEVYLSFIISSDGSLRDIRLVEEKSSANSYLREIALRSIKDASPFPAFPKELDYPELSFNIVISFEIE